MNRIVDIEFPIRVLRFDLHFHGILVKGSSEQALLFQYEILCLGNALNCYWTRRCFDQSKLDLHNHLQTPLGSWLCVVTQFPYGGSTCSCLSTREDGTTPLAIEPAHQFVANPTSSKSSA